MFTDNAPDFLKGLPLDGSEQLIIEEMKKRDCLVSVLNYGHRYPYDWRSKKPVIVRSTKQWFIHLNDIKANIPKIMRSFLDSNLLNEKSKVI